MFEGMEPMPSGKGRRVVLVDDDASMSCALERILRLAGYAPRIFSSAEAALQDPGACQADCLVLDVHLPGLTGFELYKKLGCSGKAPPVIFITAYDEPDSRNKAGDVGAAGYFIKPFSGNELVAAVTKAVKSTSENLRY